MALCSLISFAEIICFSLFRLENVCTQHTEYLSVLWVLFGVNLIGFGTLQRKNILDCINLSFFG